MAKGKQDNPVDSVTALRIAQAKLIKMIENDEIGHRQACEINNAFGKILASVKVQMDYARLRGEEPDIPFAK